jgi:structural maintenance of chromosome 4
VVDTTLCAQQCIDFLRKNNLGRATFIVLDKMAPPKEMKNIPQGGQRLYDLINTKDEVYRKAFYYALRDTLVAADLKTANTIAYSGSTRFRVVTLDGKLIDISGTMSGGGNRVARGGMKSAVSEINPEDVAALEKERELLVGKLEAMGKEIETYQSQLVELNGVNDKLKKELIKDDIELQQIKAQGQDLEKQKAELGTISADVEATKKDKDRITEITMAIKKHNEKLEKLKESAAPYESKIQELQAKIMEVGGVKLKSQQSKVDLLKEQSDHLISRNSKLKVERESTSKSIRKIEKSLQKQQDEIAEVEKVLEELETSIQEKLGAALNLKKECDKAKSVAEEKRETLQEFKTLIEESSKDVNKFRTFEVNGDAVCYLDKC